MTPKKVVKTKKEKAPDPTPKFQLGTIVYHRLTYDPVMLLHAWVVTDRGVEYEVRYTVNGRLVADDFWEIELTDINPKKANVEVRPPTSDLRYIYQTTR